VGPRQKFTAYTAHSIIPGCYSSGAPGYIRVPSMMTGA